MGTKMKVSAAVLVALAGVYLVTRTAPAESPRRATLAPPAADVELQEPIDAELLSAPEDPATEDVRRSTAREEPPAGVAATRGTNVLRLVLEGITEDSAGMAQVTVTAFDQARERSAKVRDSWPCRGLTSDFDLDPYLAAVERHEGLNVDELEVEVDHPQHLSEKTRVSLARDVEPTNGKTVYEVRVQFVRPEFWPEFTLAVRDANTRAQLEDIELRFSPGASTSMWGRNSLSTLFGDGLRSPIALMGGRDADEPEASVAHLAVRPAAGESPRLVKLAYATRRYFGFIASARAPGYAWGSIVLDFSESDERELLLTPGSAIDVRLANVQLERYRALETKPMLCVYRNQKDGGHQWVHYEPLDETLETEGLRLDGLKPGGYRVTVELGGGSWTKRPVLAREEFAGALALVAGETRAMVLTLADPPSSPERATLGGTVSLPTFGGLEKVRLQLYFQPTQEWRKPDVEFALTDLPRASGALPSWSFRAQDLPVGMYRVQLLPFLKVWMIELPARGLEDVQLVLPELAEVLVETVDGQSGKRVPLDEFHYRRESMLPGQVQHDRARADTEEPGRFRFWTAPGAISMWPRGQGRLGYGGTGKDLELVPGLQSVRFELPPACLIRFEFRIDGAAPQLSDGIWEWMHYGTLESVRAVDHGGHCRGRTGERVAEVSAPGAYEIEFEALTQDRFHPIPPRLVTVRAGETAEVIVELQRK